ncbi:uncharacterized protein C12orf50 homolog isoform X3 [Pseudophryne corroboree]|uniref:uncharacterized protein C12orf50 homolog isoform X3 n=1 Tax=Pseudophryne corroboree TaxID=495146 RepID=UPI0030814D4D
MPQCTRRQYPSVAKFCGWLIICCCCCTCSTTIGPSDELHESDILDSLLIYTISDSFQCTCPFLPLESEIPCLWEGETSDCTDINCPYLHTKARYINNLFLPPSIDVSSEMTEETEEIEETGETEETEYNFWGPLQPALIIHLTNEEDEEDEVEEQNDHVSSEMTEETEEIEETEETGETEYNFWGPLQPPLIIHLTNEEDEEDEVEEQNDPDEAGQRVKTSEEEEEERAIMAVFYGAGNIFEENYTSHNKSAEEESNICSEAARSSILNRDAVNITMDRIPAVEVPTPESRRTPEAQLSLVS